MADGIFNTLGFMTPEQVQQTLSTAAAQVQPAAPTPQPVQGAFGVPDIRPTGNIQAAQLDVPLQPSRQFFGTTREDPRLVARRGLAQNLGEIYPEVKGKYDSSEWWTKYGEELRRTGDLGGAVEALKQASSLRQAEVQGTPEQAQEVGPFQEIPGAKGFFGQRILSGPKKGQYINVRKEGAGIQIGFGEKEESKAKVEIAKKDYETVTTQGSAAAKELATIDQARTLLSDETFQTGRLEPLKAEVSAYASAFGVDPATLGLETADTPQRFRTIMSGLVLQKASQMKGNLSDKDVKFLKESTANLADAKTANRQTLDAAKAMASLEKIRGDFYREQFATDTPLTKINNEWRKSPYNTNVIGKSPRGEVLFWNQYYDNAISANRNNPDYIDKQKNFMMDKLLMDIKKGWESYAVR